MQSHRSPPSPSLIRHCALSSKRVSLERCLWNIGRSLTRCLPLLLRSLRPAYVLFLPTKYLALTRSQIHNALEEWNSGYFIKRPMKEEWYGAIYRRYFKKLGEFEATHPNRHSLLMSSFFMFCSYVLTPFKCSTCANPFQSSISQRHSP
jgi:Domain of unknown function (DUF6532)